MRQFMFSALVTLNPPTRLRAVHSPEQHYPSHTQALVILAQPLRADGGPAWYLLTESWRDDELPLRPGDHVPGDSQGE